MGKQEFRSENGEYFAANIQEIQDQVKQQLQESSNKYKQRVDFERRNLDFDVGDLVMAHFQKKNIS